MPERRPRGVPYSLQVGDLIVTVIRKPNRHMYMRVDRRTGEVRLTVPLAATDVEIRALVGRQRVWIARKQSSAARIGRTIASNQVANYRFSGRACASRLCPAAARRMWRGRTAS